jgi:predicted nucleotide-binding protein (sugar kinase/HSP70/actin superfamily)
MKNLTEHMVPKPLFTKEMKKDYTILVPQMLSVHFPLLLEVFKQYGYNMELLDTTHRGIVDEGLKNVHNDTCYPALLVIGQMMDALKSGKYDIHKVALLITQTGGGCRASNYAYLLRKALEKNNMGFIPVITLNINSMETHPGFEFTKELILKAIICCIYGDLMMGLKNQCLPYEVNKGETMKVIDDLTQKLAETFKTKEYKRLKKNMTMIVKEMNKIERNITDKVKVGIVGEIYVKYAPLGNNRLEEYLLSEGAEPVLTGVLDFLLYGFNNNLVDARLYVKSTWKTQVVRLICAYIMHLQNKMTNIIKKHSNFRPLSTFSDVKKAAQGIISDGVKMGEGWLLTGEMVEFIQHGINNIITTQPFGCLPNHIVAKGMIRNIKNKYPNANIVAIDYDPGATKTNQENRIKLMLANAAAYKKAQADENNKNRKQSEKIILVDRDNDSVAKSNLA